MELNLTLFLTPLMTGCLYALMLPLLGALLRLQDEWWAALGFPYLAAATGLGGLAAGIPLAVGAPMGTLGGALVRRLWETRGNSGYAFMTLLGWAAIGVMPANTNLSGVTVQTLVDGRMLVTGSLDLRLAALLLVTHLVVLPWLMPRLVRARLFLAQSRANEFPVGRWQLGFSVLVALTLAQGTLALGVMGTFALTVVPAWIAFRLARSWRWTLILGATLGVGTCLAALALALGLDQPFGPVLVGLLVLLAGLMALVRPVRG